MVCRGCVDEASEKRFKVTATLTVAGGSVHDSPAHFFNPSTETIPMAKAASTKAKPHPKPVSKTKAKGKKGC